MARWHSQLLVSATAVALVLVPTDLRAQTLADSAAIIRETMTVAKAILAPRGELLVDFSYRSYGDSAAESRFDHLVDVVSAARNGLRFVSARDAIVCVARRCQVNGAETFAQLSRLSFEGDRARVVVHSTTNSPMLSGATARQGTYDRDYVVILMRAGARWLVVSSSLDRIT